LKEECYRVTSSDHRKTRETLTHQPGVLAAMPMGADLHLFVEPEKTSIEALHAIVPFDSQRIQPSLEDVFIALMYEQEAAHAA
jgi:hypothetical protein